MNLYQRDVYVTLFVAICRYEFIVFQLFLYMRLIVCPQQVLQPGIIVVAVDGAKFCNSYYWCLLKNQKIVALC